MLHAYFQEHLVHFNKNYTKWTDISESDLYGLMVAGAKNTLVGVEASQVNRTTCSCVGFWQGRAFSVISSPATSHGRDVAHVSHDLHYACNALHGHKDCVPGMLFILQVNTAHLKKDGCPLSVDTYFLEQYSFFFFLLSTKNDN